MSDCVFCQIVAGDQDSDIVYQDDEITAFRDINPAAPTHVLIVPNRHTGRLATIDEADADLFGKMILLASQIAAQEGVAESGYRVLVNQGPDSGQIIEHLHWHLLGGKRLSRLG